MELHRELFGGHKFASAVPHTDTVVDTELVGKFALKLTAEDRKKDRSRAR
jgi:hypothetical protein